MEIISSRTTSFVIALFFFIVIVRLIRRGKLHEKYSFGWFLIGWGILIFGTFPKLVDGVAAYLGIRYPPILMIYIGMCLLFSQELFLFICTSQNEARIKELAQELAILKKILEENDEKAREESAGSHSGAPATPTD